jgi:hypothetical protein
MQMAEKKVWAQRSERVAMRHQSLSLANMFSILWRFQARMETFFAALHSRDHRSRKS